MVLRYPIKCNVYSVQIHYQCSEALIYQERHLLGFYAMWLL
jgi:hypothetical protein